jgi:hypothetical protein
MRTIYTLLILFTFWFSGNAQSNWEKMWEEIQNGIKDGTFDDTKFNLGDLLNLGDFDMGILGDGGSKAFGDGGIFGSGGLFDISPGGFLGGLFGDIFGFDEIHNDASLNSNVTWGILHTNLIRDRITDKQNKIISMQDSINKSVKRLYELEKLTVDYLSTKQSDAVDIESFTDLLRTAEDIGFFYTQSSALCDKSPNLDYVKQRMTLIVVTRTWRIVDKMLNFARVDGTNHLLNNEDRDVIATNLINDMRELRGTLSYAYRALLSGSNYGKLHEQTGLYNTIDQMYKK